MISVQKRIQLATNRDRLMQEIRSQYPNAQFRFSEHSPIEPFVEVIDDTVDDVVITNIVHDHNPAILTTEQQNEQDDTNERILMLARANSDIVELEADRDNWGNLLTVTLLRPVLFKMLIAIIRIYKVQRAILRSGLN